MKSKIFALILILVFLVSTISVLAVSTNQDNDILNKILGRNKLNKDTSQIKEKPKGRETIKSFAQEKLDRVREMKIKTTKNIQKLSKLPFKKELGFKARKIPFFEIKRARDQINETQFRIRIAEKGYKATNEEIKEQKKQRENCIEGTKTCNEIKNNLNLNFKKQLAHISNIMIRNLNKLKYKVSVSEEIKEVQADDINLEIDREISELETLRDKIFTLKEGITKEEIKEERELIKVEWKKTKLLIQSVNNKLTHPKQGRIITKLNHLKLKLETTLERLIEKGSDTEELEDLIDEFESKINLAENEYNNVVESFETYDIEKSNEQLKQTERLLHQSHQKVKEIILEIKNIDGEKEFKEEIKK